MCEREREKKEEKNNKRNVDGGVEEKNGRNVMDWNVSGRVQQE